MIKLPTKLLRLAYLKLITLERNELCFASQPIWASNNRLFPTNRPINIGKSTLNTGAKFVLSFNLYCFLPFSPSFSLSLSPFPFLRVPDEVFGLLKNRMNKGSV